MRTVFEVLSEDERGQIHERTLHVLATTGMRVDTAQGRDILRDAGAQVDDDSHIVRFPGFTLEMTAHALSVLDSYIYGFGRQQLNMSPEGDVTPEEMAEAFLHAIPADEYPHLREMVVEHAMKSGYDESADFGFGLDLILDGLQKLLNQSTS